MRNVLTMLTVSATLTLAACSGGESKNGDTKASENTASKTVSTITGAGASFPQPVYSQWAQAYQQKTGNQVNYQSIGSSGGVKQIVAKTVDFGASDSPLKADELEEKGLIQFPTVIGGVVPVVNIEGIKAGELTLTGEILADIYLGKITHWNDTKIASLNSDLKLPNAPITTVFRSDGSGTSFNFTNYLSKVSEDWANKVGSANSVKWPTAETGVAGKGNEGVSALLTQVKNSIGYVEYAYAKQNNIAHTALVNQAGQKVQPSQETFAAAANTDWASAPGFYLILTNQADEKAWPIAAATFILIHKKTDDANRSKEVLSFFDWAYLEGNQYATNLDYVPMPQETKDLIRSSWKAVTDQNGQAVWK